MPFVYPVDYDAAGSRSPFLVDVPAGWEPTLNDEHDDYRWCSRDEAVELLHWPEPKELVRSLSTSRAALRGEGPPALWHVSEDATIARFEPLRRARLGDRHASPAALLVPARLPARDLLGAGETSDEDVERLLDGDRTRRVHVIESGVARADAHDAVVAYRLPEESFEPEDRFWVSRATVEPLELRRARRPPRAARRGRDRAADRAGAHPLWEPVVASTLDFSGIRLRNATLCA